MSTKVESTPTKNRKPSPMIRRLSSKSLSDSSDSGALLLDTSSLSSEKRAMTPKMEVRMKLEAKKKRDEEQYTFKPNVNTSDYPSPDRGTGAKRFEALYEDAKKRKELGPQKKASITAAIDKDLTFQPILSTTASVSGASDGIGPQKAVNIADVVERLYKPDRSRREEIENKIKEANTPTNQPKISKRAQSIDRTTSLLNDIGDRLYHQSKLQREKLDKLKEIEDLKASTELTFAPKMSTKSRSLSANRLAKEEGSKDIVERVKKYEEAKLKRLEAAAEERKKQELAQATFKPTINASSKRFATPTRTGDLFERLSKPVDKDGLAAKQIAELEASFFQPQLLSKRSPSVTSIANFSIYLS
jgi:hypothetical protein